MSKPQHLGDCLLQMQKRKATTALKFKVRGHWIEKSWQDYYQDIEIIGAALLELGIQQGDRVALMANTRYEWSVFDYAIFGIRAITVPIYQNNTTEDLEFILNNCEASVMVCETRGSLKIFEAVKAQCPSVQAVLVLDEKSPAKGILGWEELKAIGKKKLKEDPKCYRLLCEQIRKEDTATILYTSGTTGKPKGVVLTHLQAFSEVSEAFPFCGVNDTDVSLSFLPYAHVLGRIEHWGHLFIGYTMAYAESIEKIRSNLPDVRPTILVAVPRIFEKIHSAIWAQIQTQPLRLKLFTWALSVGREVADHRMRGETISVELLLKYELAKKLVLSKITDAFGGRLRFAISGGAPLSYEISRFFDCAGVLILEGYGLTETTAAISVNTPFNYRFGSVGRPIGEVQVKIAEDGELLVRSDKVMKEYYKNPEATKETLQDGWFHTGDIAEILPGGDIKITDRKKDLIKTAGGKYVAPQRLESFLKNSPYISNVHIYGDQKKYIVALLTLDQQKIEEACNEKSISASSWAELLKTSYVQDIVRQAVANTNTNLASFESIKKYAVLPQEFTVENGELTPSLKVKRKVVDQKYKDIIESLY